MTKKQEHVIITPVNVGKSRGRSKKVWEYGVCEYGVGEYGVGEYRVQDSNVQMDGETAPAGNDFKNRLPLRLPCSSDRTLPIPDLS